MSIEKLKKEAKNLLRLLPDFVRQHAGDLKLSDCQALVARMHGYPDWHAASSKTFPSPDSDIGGEPDVEVTEEEGMTVGRIPGTKFVVQRRGTGDAIRNSLAEHLREIQVLERRKRKAHEEGIPALRRLFDVAHGHSGQCRYIAAFLLALYNGTRFPFDMTSLRSIDAELFEDCIRVLRMDEMPEREVHAYFDHGGHKFEDLAQRWAITDVRRLKMTGEQLVKRGVRSFASEEQLVSELEHAFASTWPAEGST